MSDTFAVLVRANGKLLGRLTPDGHVTNRVMQAAMLSKKAAEQIAGEINSGINLDDDAPSQLTAKVIKF
jgi:hypothetical protein